MYNENEKSTFRTITHGIPQGSIFSPFFILYINYFFKASHLLFSTLFADETTII